MPWIAPGITAPDCVSLQAAVSASPLPRTSPAERSTCLSGLRSRTQDSPSLILMLRCLPGATKFTLRSRFTIPISRTMSQREQIERVMALEREAFAVDRRVKRIRKASASFASAETLIMNSCGSVVSYTSTACSASIEVVAEEKGESQAGSDYDVNRFYNKLRIEETGAQSRATGARSSGSEKHCFGQGARGAGSRRSPGISLDHGQRFFRGERSEKEISVHREAGPAGSCLNHDIRTTDSWREDWERRRPMMKPCL